MCHKIPLSLCSVALLTTALPNSMIFSHFQFCSLRLKTQLCLVREVVVVIICAGSLLIAPRHLTSREGVYILIIPLLYNCSVNHKTKQIIMSRKEMQMTFFFYLTLCI